MVDIIPRDPSFDIEDAKVDELQYTDYFKRGFKDFWVPFNIQSADSFPYFYWPSLLDLANSDFSAGNFLAWNKTGNWNVNTIEIPGTFGRIGYSWYTDSLNNPSNESEMDNNFDTSNSSVTFQDSGIRDQEIAWSDGGNSYWGGTMLSKPGYLSSENFAWKAEGYIEIPSDGDYFFALDSDDASDVFVGGQKVADYYGGHGMGDSNANESTVTLSAGIYSFLARLTQGTGGSGIAIGWQKPEDSSTSNIPIGQFTDSFVDITVAQAGGGNNSDELTRTINISTYSDKIDNQNPSTTLHCKRGSAEDGDNLNIIFEALDQSNTILDSKETGQENLNGEFVTRELTVDLPTGTRKLRIKCVPGSFTNTTNTSYVTNFAISSNLEK